MGFSLFKKKDKSATASPYNNNNNNNNNNISASTNGSTGILFKSNSSPPTKSKSSSSAFSRLFRSQPASSSTDRNIHDVTSTSSKLIEPNFPRRRTSSTPDSSSPKLNLELSKHWQESSVSLDVLDHEVHRETMSEASHSIGPSSGNRFRNFIGANGITQDDSEMESLSQSQLRGPLEIDGAEMKEKRMSRLFGGHKKRTSSIASSSLFAGERDSRISEDSAAGFEVKSFRVVSRVQEGPYSSPYISSSPYDTSQHPHTSPQASPSVSHIPLLSNKAFTKEFRPPPLIATESDRPPSPTISVEAFRLATARSRSSTSLNLLASPEESERPRFEPRRSSILVDSTSVSSPDEMKRPEFARADSSSSSRLALNQKIRPSSLYTPTTLPQEIRYSRQEPSSLNTIYSNSKSSSTTPTSRLRAPAVITERPPTAWRNSSADFSQMSKSANKKWEDSDSSDDEDDVPLARLKAASVSDLTSAVKGLGLGGNRVEIESEQEVLCASPVEETLDQKDEKDRSNKLVQSTSPLSTSFGLGHPRGMQRRSISTLAYSTSPLFNSPPPSSSSPRLTPLLSSRSYSNPSSPKVIPGFSMLDLPLPISSPSTSASVSPVFDQRHSTSSVNNSDSSASSLLHTPNDQSPGVSTLGVKIKSPTQPGTERAVKFDVQTLTNSNESEKKWNNRLSALQPLPGKSSMSSGSSFNQSTVNSTRTLSHAASEAELKATRRASMFVESTAAPAKLSTLDRMKIRHKAETMKALALGRDLNGPGDIVDDSEEEDDDTPLSGLGQLRQRGSTYFNQPPQFYPQQLQQQHLQHQQQQFYSPPPPSTFYSAPPGVDPQLYYSLPMDQRMALDARANQMMQMMQGYSLQAKAESQGGWDSGSNASGGSSEIGVATGGGGSYNNIPGNRASMMSMNGFGFPPSNQRLPVFAPSNATSQPFFQPLPPQQFQPQFQPYQQFQPQFQPNFYGNPYASSSDIGVSRSDIGRTGGKVKRTKVLSSIGTGRKN